MDSTEVTISDHINAMLAVTAAVFIFGTAAHFTMSLINHANDARIERNGQE